MSGKMKGVLTSLILLVVIVIITAQFIPQIANETAIVSDNTTLPAVVRTAFGLWWIPIALIIIGLFVGGGSALGISRRRSSRRRRR